MAGIPLSLMDGEFPWEPLEKGGPLQSAALFNFRGCISIIVAS